MAVDGGERRMINNGCSAACTGNLVEDILPHFLVGEAGKVIMHGDSLLQRLMNRLFQGIVQM